MVAGGGYITFQIAPDSNHPCASEYYWIEINGRVVGRASSNCTASIYLSTPGRYSWRVRLYIFETATTVTGPVTTFTVLTPQQAPPVTTPVTTPAATVPEASPASTDTSAPTAKASAAYGSPRQRISLGVVLDDDSGTATMALGVFKGKKQLASGSRRYVNVDGGRFVVFHWTPPTAGVFKFCALAQDAAGNRSATSCAVVSIR